MARTRMTEEVLGELVAVLDPELVASVAAWLVHEDCQVTGEVYTAAAGRAARFFIGMTPGFYSPSLTAEDVCDHFDEVNATDGFMEPTSSPGEIEYLRSLLEESGR
jgi:hypothetical protein